VVGGGRWWSMVGGRSSGRWWSMVVDGGRWGSMVGGRWVDGGRWWSMVGGRWWSMVVDGGAMVVLWCRWSWDVAWFLEWDLRLSHACLQPKTKQNTDRLEEKRNNNKKGKEGKEFGGPARTPRSCRFKLLSNCFSSSIKVSKSLSMNLVSVRITNGTSRHSSLS
jgi:hypothetical protein